MKNKYLIIDFDSTFIRCEALDKLAYIVLANHPDKRQIIEKIKKITQDGMEGKITFTRSFQKRMAWVCPTKDNLDKFTRILKKQVSASFIRNRQFIRSHCKQIYIVSGGFREYIEPITKSFGIYKSHILANQFVYGKNGIVGYDQNSMLAKTRGKIKAVMSLNLVGKIYVVGDGYTDFQIKEAGLATKFIAYCENVQRKMVREKADHIANSFEDLIKFF